MVLVRVLDLLASHKNWALERGIDEAKQFPGMRSFGDIVEHRGAGRTDSSETYPTREA